jgi:predicted short-subunit dehydrogenase-like oxidoreductase (DUF2520 family)
MKPISESSIGFIGAGKVGNALGSYFHHHRLCIGGYYSLHESSSQKATHKTNSIVFHDIAECIHACDIIFITTPDSSIREVWETIKKTSIHEKVICHTSGAVSSHIFDGIDQNGAFGYAVHPVVSIPSDPEAYCNLHQAHFTIEGSAKRLSDLQAFFINLGNSVVLIDAEKKSLYHAANVFLSNFLVVLVQSGWNILQECNIPSSTIKAMAKSLLESSLQNIMNYGIEPSLTGPIERNDIQTIQRHLEALSERDRKTYSTLSIELLEIAKKKHPQRDFTDLSSSLLHSLENDRNEKETRSLQ